MRLLAAPKGGVETPSSRYRIHAVLPRLEPLGWGTAALRPSNHGSRRAPGLAADLRRALEGSDVLLVQRPGRRREEGLVLRVAGLRSRITVVDLDDPVESVGPMRWALERASLVLAGSEAIVRRYQRRVPRIEYVPTGLDFGRYERGDAHDRPLPVVGWIGDGPAYRESLVRMIGAVAASGHPVSLRIVGTRGDSALHAALRQAAAECPVELVPGIRWEDEDTVAAEIARFDIGLAPFRDTEGGSFKTVQYIAANVVPIAEAGGEAERHLRRLIGGDALVVRPGRAEETAERLRLVADREERRRRAAAARAAAEPIYDVGRIAIRLDRVLRDLLAGRHA